jgi:hypothetical protein
MSGCIVLRGLLEGRTGTITRTSIAPGQGVSRSVGYGRIAEFKVRLIISAATPCSPRRGTLRVRRCGQPKSLATRPLPIYEMGSRNIAGLLLIKLLMDNGVTDVADLLPIKSLMDNDVADFPTRNAIQCSASRKGEMRGAHGKSGRTPEAQTAALRRRVHDGKAHTGW